MFPFLTAFMIFIVVIALLRARVSRTEKERTDSFWKKESEANSARKVDLSTITYFSFDPAGLPKPPGSDDQLQQLYDAVTDASEKQMLNLNGINNTDLKLKYGPQNLEALTVYGDNFSALENAILSYGTALHDQGYLNEAIAVLEKGITLPTDLTGNYTRLASYYEEKGTVRKLKDLSAMADANLTGFARDSVLKHLTEMQKEDDAENIAI